MLLSKIRDSLIRINPNANLNNNLNTLNNNLYTLNNNLNSSMNNSYNNSSSRNDYNNQLGNALQTSYVLQDNSMVTDRNAEMDEPINILNGQELLIIPESPEFDSETSSENSKTIHESNTISIEEKKNVELSISENISFSYSTIYDNLNKISEGNYSKDISLQKSVMKLIGFYLKEKTKSKNKGNSEFSFFTLNKKDKERSKEKEKDKDKDKEKSSCTKNNITLKKEKNNSKKDEKKEEDVWAFLNEDENAEHQNLKFKLSTSDSKDSSEVEEKNYSRTPKGKVKKNVEFTVGIKNKSRFNKKSSNLYDNQNSEVYIKSRSRKKILKKRTKKGADILRVKKCTTIISPKKNKKQIINKDKNKYKSNKVIKINNNLNKKENNSNNNDTISSSLNLTISDNIDHQETYIKSLYKTFQKKKNNAEDNKCHSKNEENSSKMKIEK